MNKYYILFFSVLVYGLVQAQTYVPFPTAQDSIAWKDAEFFWGNTTESFIYIANDTIIDSKTYSKVYKGYYLFEDSLNNLITFIREENKIIYSKNLSGSAERILYDFNLNLGDSLSFDFETAIVVKIDSVQLQNNEFRKQYYLYHPDWIYYEDDTAKIVEGFGNIKNGLMLPFGVHYTDGGFNTYCLFSPSEVFYNLQSSISDCYKLENPISVQELNSDDLIIYPNPTNNLISFSEKISNSRLSILNLTGQIVFEEKAFSGTQLDISFLEKGIYFLKLEGELSGFIRLVKL